MSRTSRTLTNTDLAFLLCTLAAAAHSPKASLSFETDYGLVLSLEPDGSITISLRKPPAPVPKREYTDLDPFDSATPIKSQQLFAFPSPSVPGADFSHGHGSIDGVLFSPGPLSLSSGMGMGMGMGMGGASITPARSTPSGLSSPTLARTSSQTQSQNVQTRQRNMTPNKSNSPKIKYYIRPGLDANCSSHMYYTASASTSTSTSTSTTQPQPQHQSQPQPTGNTKHANKLRLHRVKLSHLQSLYHTPSNSRSNSWFDSYLDWIDRLEDALTQQHQRQQEPRTPQTPRTAVSLGSGQIRSPGTSFPLSPTNTSTSRAQTSQKTNQGGPFTDEGEKSLWLVEGMLLASWLSLQEGVEGVEYLPLPDGGMEVYRLENLQGMEGVKNENNAGVMMGRLLEVLRAGE